MQNSRLANIAYKSLKPTKLHLLQQITTSEFAEDKPIKNTSTLYLDQNGRQRQLSEINASFFGDSLENGNKPTLLKKKSSKKQDKELVDADVNEKDMYALPVVNQRGGNRELRSRAFEEGKKAKLISSQYMSDRKQRGTNLDSIKQTVQDKTSKSLLSIKRPKGFQKRPKMQQIDFIGGNLYEVQDIISQITKIVTHSTKKNLTSSLQAPTSQKSPLKTNKWLNNNFGNLSKLDELLQNYKSIPDQQDNSLQISQAFYRESTYAKEKERKGTPEIDNQIKSKFKLNNAGFVNKNKQSKEQKLSLVVVRWNQMPMIGCQWDESIFLKLQSYPQQQQYRKVVLKAYDNKIKSYSIFFYKDAGIKQSQKSNDKNRSGQSLMSQQQYAKTWEKMLPQNILSQQQRELLMQFDIEWYRTLIQLCYHSGLEDLLQKSYDIEGYKEVLQKIQRIQVAELSSTVVIVNQMMYLRKYFMMVYNAAMYETVIGLVRIRNDEGMDKSEVENSFREIVGDTAGIWVWGIKEDNSQLLLVIKLYAENTSNNLASQESSIRIKMTNPSQKQPFSYSVLLTNSQSLGSSEGQDSEINRILLKPEQENDWQFFIKMENQILDSLKYEVKTVEEFMFGVLFSVQVNKS